MFTSDIQLAIHVDRGRDTGFIVKGSFSELKLLSHDFSKAIEANSGSNSISDIYSCPILQSNGKKNDAYLVFQVDSDAIFSAQKASRGFKGIWNDAGGCLVQCVLIALAAKGVISFFG